MANAHKLLEQMRQNPRDWRIEQLEIVANHYNITVRKSTGSHVVFTHPKWTMLLCVSAHRPIKPIYVKKLVTLINTLG